MSNALKRRLRGDFSGSVLEEEPLSRHTTMRIGGPARFYIEADDFHSLITVCEACRDLGIAWTILGGGSNLLVSDEGFDGAVIVLGEGFSKCIYDEATGVFTAGAALRLSQLVRRAASLERTGLEFAVGIPGTVGGAIRMNAGTRREFIGPRIESVTTYRPGVGLLRYLGSDISWDYRETSIPFDEVVLECSIATSACDAESVRRLMEKSQQRRRITQPLGLPSCGSVFRNPSGESVGRLIENVGLKGALCGGAQISPKHANFIVNLGGARAVEVLSLIHAACDAVADKYEIDLVPEVRFLGFE